MTTEGLTIENEEGRDVLLLQPIDSERAEAISTPAARFLCALARIVADTQWDKLDPDETIWLLDTLRFNAHETLAAEDVAREGDARTVALQEPTRLVLGTVRLVPKPIPGHGTFERWNVWHHESDEVAEDLISRGVVHAFFNRLEHDNPDTDELAVRDAVTKALDEAARVALVSVDVVVEVPA